MKKDCWNLTGICRNVQIMSGNCTETWWIPDIIKTSCDVRNPPRFGTLSGVIQTHPDIFDNVFRIFIFHRVVDKEARLFNFKFGKKIAQTD